MSITRKKVIIIIMSLLLLLSGIVIIDTHASGDAGGGGDSEGTPGAGHANYSGNQFVWFDNGEWESEGYTEPVQHSYSSPNEISRWDVQFWANKLDAKISGTVSLSFNRSRWYKINDSYNNGYNNSFQKTLEEAIQSALNRRRPGSTAKARIVGVGITWGRGLPDLGLPNGRWTIISRYANIDTSLKAIVPREGNSTELKGAGWNSLPEPNKYNDVLPGETWREYIYRIWKKDTTGDSSVYVNRWVTYAVAVLDDEAPSGGDVTIQKVSNRTDTSYSIADAKFTIYEEDGTTIAKDNNGTALSNLGLTNGKTTTYTLSAGTYVIKETSTPSDFETAPSQTVTIVSGESKIVTFTNELKPGRGKVNKTF